mgnify:FL=1
MVEPIFIDGRELSDKCPPYIIAEISANHNGSIDRALETILAAKKSGVDAVKIQSYTPDTMTIQSDRKDFMISKGLWRGRSLFDLYSEAFTPFEWHSRLFEYARKIGITLFSTPFDETAADLLGSLETPAYKIASFELVDLPLIKYVAEKGKPMLISTGMASLQEIGKAIETARSNGCKDIAIFHCISSYPTPLEQANLRLIGVLQHEFKVQVGLSDHTMGNLAGIVATGLGVTLIEKHLTLSRSDGGVDSEFSMEPAEMKKFVIECKAAFNSLGSPIFRRSDLEEENKIFRRSLYFVENLKEGSIITSKHVRRIRPGYGLHPQYLNKVIGSKVKKDVSRGDRVSLYDVDL